jgi:hypothetical protein
MLVVIPIVGQLINVPYLSFFTSSVVQGNVFGILAEINSAPFSRHFLTQNFTKTLQTEKSSDFVTQSSSSILFN